MNLELVNKNTAKIALFFLSDSEIFHDLFYMPVQYPFLSLTKPLDFSFK